MTMQGAPGTITTGQEAPGATVTRQEAPGAITTVRVATGEMRVGMPEQAPRRALVAVVGLGYAGLSTVTAARSAGLAVLGIEPSPSRLAEIRSGRVGLLGPQRQDLRARLREEGLVLSSRIEEVHAADLVLICVATSLDRQRRPSHAALARACAAVVQNARAGQTVVLASASRVGATRELLVEPLAARGLGVGEDVFVAFSAERVEPAGSERKGQGSARVIGAVSETCFRHTEGLLRPICRDVHRVCSPEAAEMLELCESTARAVNLALSFELADACRTHGVDPLEIADAAAGTPLGFTVSPAPAVGAARVGVDPHCLVHPLRERGRPAALAEEAVRRLDARPRRLAMRAHELLLRSGRELRDARVLVVGACGEPGVADGRDAPAIEIIERLRAAGAHVDFHDPLVSVLRIDGEEFYGVDPDPRRDASGFGPEDYDLAVLIALRSGHDYGWLKRCAQVLDCTYRAHTGRRRYLP